MNHGKFYIDTTISAEKQAKQHINEFRAGETYYLFLLFAKADTDQTYQMYVGKNAGDSFLAENVNMTRVNPKGVPFSFEKESWPGQWQRSYDPASGILSVRLDLSDIQPEIDMAEETQCLPSSVCKFENKQCVTSLPPEDYLYQEFVDGKICENALRAVDCPAGGCYGFSVTMPDSFSTDLPVDPRPMSELFSTDPSFDWDVEWQFSDPDIAGDCANPPTE